MENDRESEALIGPVRSVRIHATKLPARIERPCTSGRTLEQLITYDSEGRTLEEIIYNEDGSLGTRRVYMYDQAQHVGWTLFDQTGSVVVRYVYILDQDGRRVEELSYGGDGKLQERITQTCDARGRVVEQASYTPDGALSLKEVRTYDAQGRMVENGYYIPKHLFTGIEQNQEGAGYIISDASSEASRVLQQDGFIENRMAVTYSDDGKTVEVAWYMGNALSGKHVTVEHPERNTFEVTRYDGSGSIQSREIIERLKFDGHGNWIEERVSTWVAGASASEPTEVEPTELHQREITYY